MTIKAVVFDLDGTLLDSLEDIAFSVNAAMRKVSCPEHSVETIRSFVGYGIARLIKDALPKDVEKGVYNEACDFFYKHYVEHADSKTVVYPGILDMLKQLKSMGIILAVLSNKAEPAVEVLCDNFFPGIFKITAGAREDFFKKPDPTRLLSILKELEVTAASTVYVGDSDVDVYTAHNAKVHSIAVDWGYRNRKSLLAAGASTIVSNANEIIKAVKYM